MVELYETYALFHYHNNMILRYYRYVLLLKLVCLIWGLYYFLHDRYTPHVEWWTTIVVYTQSWVALERLKPMLDKTPLPLSLIVYQSRGAVLHIPRTNDVEYVLWYLWAPFPQLRNIMNDTSAYTKACKKRLIIQSDSIYEETCYYTPYKNILILLCMLFVMLV